MMTDHDYRDWIHRQPCVVCSRLPEPQTTRTEMHHHTRRRGKGQKADDKDSFPLCTYHHRCFHDACGCFKTWDKAKRGHFQDSECARAREAYHAEQGEDEVCRQWDEVF